ncbi:hypothetical protein DH2020_026038 [Rehmannia glutinosa]|uniref:UDP-glycosyltransferase n=1 Tax=Rehmannia glutinosa TaxID=99300 RepID=A0ABR0VYA7_REHGL
MKYANRGKSGKANESGLIEFELGEDELGLWWDRIRIKISMAAEMDTKIMGNERFRFIYERSQKDIVDLLHGYNLIGVIREYHRFYTRVQSIKSKDLMSYLQDVDISKTIHQIVIKAFEQVKSADFILINTVHELEHETIQALNQKHPTYAIGPINFSTNFTKTVVPKSLWSETDCTEWLNSKPPGSVLYVSFGSLAQSNKQLAEEIAYGLLLSEINFIWVLRENRDVLPDGLKNDMRDKGLFVSWCNQNGVISNPAVGGKLVVDDWKIGINLCDGISVTREEVAEKIKELMSGEMKNGLRNEIKKIRSVVHKALGKDGSSQRNFDHFILCLISQTNMEDKLVMKPHAIMIALPYQGHLNPFVHLAIKLASKGFKITFVLTQHFHHQISKSHNNTITSSDEIDIFSGAGNSGLDIRYATISDGFPLEFDRNLNVDEFWESLFNDFPSRVDEFVGEIIASCDSSSSPMLVTDTVYSWTGAIAKKYNLVNVSFWTEPAMVFAISYYSDLLRENGHFPTTDNHESTINYIPGIESISTKDLMAYFQESDDKTIVHKIIFLAFENVKNADFILHNTVQELESHTLSALNQKHPTYAIGPINFSKNSTKINISKSMLSEIDCTKWLDSKPPGSVLYVSFGSVVRPIRRSSKK